MKTIFLPLLLIVLITSIHHASNAADDDSRLWVATRDGKTVKWIGKFADAYDTRVSFWKTGNCDDSGNIATGIQPVKVSCDFLSLRAEDQRFIQAILKERSKFSGAAYTEHWPWEDYQKKPAPNPFDKFDNQSTPAENRSQEPFDPDKYLAQKESLPEGYAFDPPPQLTSAQIKARDFMADIESQRKALMKKAGALHILPQFFRWPKGYTADEESEYLTGNMRLIAAFQFERKCKKYIREIEALIDSAFKNIQPLPDN